MTVQAKKKRKTKPIAKGKLEALIERYAEADIRGPAKARARLADRFYREQDGATREAIDIVRDRLLERATGVIMMRPPELDAPVAVQVDADTLQFNAFYQAVEIFKDLAMMDVRVAHFKLPLNLCSTCGDEIEKKKGKKKRA